MSCAFTAHPNVTSKPPPADSSDFNRTILLSYKKFGILIVQPFAIFLRKLEMPIGFYMCTMLTMLLFIL